MKLHQLQAGPQLAPTATMQTVTYLGLCKWEHFGDPEFTEAQDHSESPLQAKP